MKYQTLDEAIAYMEKKPNLGEAGDIILLLAKELKKLQDKGGA